MEILSLSNCPLVDFQGSGYVILNFCRNLREQGHPVDLFGPESYEIFRFFKYAKSHRQAVGMLGFVLAKLAEKKYDVIEFYGGESWLAAWVLSKVHKRDFLLVSHSNGLETYCYDVLEKYASFGYIEPPFPKWYQLNLAPLFSYAFTQVDAIVTVSEVERESALNYGYQDDLHVVAINNSLPDDYLGLNVTFQREPVIGYCGSWIPRKGIQLVETDIPKLLTEFPQCRFKIIGVGETFQKEDHFPSAVCSQIEVIPFVTNKQELQKIYQQISILIAPSIYESFGLVMAEAMACGCALVANKTGFAANLEHRVAAMVFDEPMPPQLYHLVRELLMDDVLRAKVAQKGYQTVQSLRWCSAGKQLETAYQSWLAELRQEGRSKKAEVKRQK